MILLRVFHYIIFLSLINTKAFSLDECKKAISSPTDQESMAIFIQHIYDLDFLSDFKNILGQSKIEYLGDLVRRTRKQLLKFPNFGIKTVDKIEKKLLERNLHLGMEINWPFDPKQVKELVKALTPKVELSPVFARPIESLNIHPNSEKALKKTEIYYLGDLVIKKESELLALEGFAETGLDEVKLKITTLGLRLRMFIDWPSDFKQVKALIETQNLKEEPNPLLAYSIKSCGFSFELENVLQENKIHHLGDLVIKREDELLVLPGFEKSFLSEIESLLSEMGLSLRINANWPSEPTEATTLVDKLNPKVELTAVFFRLVKNLDLSNQSKKALEAENIIYVGDLVTKTEWGLQKKVPGLGKQRALEVKEFLAKRNLYLGMNIDWPSDPKQIEFLRKKVKSEQKPDLRFLQPLSALNLSDKINLLLKMEKIISIGDLVIKTATELLQIPYFGEKKLTEVEAALSKIGMSLDMDINWFPSSEQSDP